MIQVGLLLLQLEGWVIDIFEPEPRCILPCLLYWQAGKGGRTAVSCPIPLRKLSPPPPRKHQWWKSGGGFKQTRFGVKHLLLNWPNSFSWCLKPLTILFSMLPTLCRLAKKLITILHLLILADIFCNPSHSFLFQIVYTKEKFQFLQQIVAAAHFWFIPSLKIIKGI